VPDRRSGAGRRKGEEKKEETKTETSASTSQPPKPPVEQRAETEPDRRHFLHKKLGGGHKAA
jgi:hypothetical protein